MLEDDTPCPQEIDSSISWKTKGLSGYFITSAFFEHDLSVNASNVHHIAPNSEWPSTTRCFNRVKASKRHYIEWKSEILIS